MSFEVTELRVNDVPMDQVTLRDYFAAKAMQALMPGLLAEYELDPRVGRSRSAEEHARRGCEAAYKIADAMLAERSK